MQTVIVIGVISFASPRALAVGLALAVPLTLTACGEGGESDPAVAGDCPTTPVDVVVSVEQWGKIVTALGGACADVTTVLSGNSGDPHDFEPTPADAAAFTGAQLVVINGGHYDEWAVRLAESTAPDAVVVDAVALLGGDHEGHEHEDHDHDHGGANPHAWYSPAAVTDVADAVTATLTELAPDARGYLEARHTEFTAAMQPYRALIDKIRAGATGKTYAATESLFDDMAAALGLTNRTPHGYQVASSNHADPSPADLDAFLRLLSDRGVDVLIYNTQTEGSLPQQLRTAAERAGVPVVDVTETPAPDAATFEAWQVAQLTALAAALGIEA
ncbi:metal ABC transporter solute-binding protein, Zn/Mn family [Mycolicibacterium diernhoferi]|uniref:ABC transporter substrate-binding protein n=1 Tax=Mycolicibacterium diernhoferi TaxID=1801 RepID=A0A1Q4HDX5_9MYCO|nr:zinc ABC transporter substrate-binding protein [Mycolicibacterium diernhoferi]OJZ65622.1 ABC transporter substrate-binding protein [Mycolicibacterium diernhoferi]OPE55935.1 ABC transporter substrate-binding protein [Mycolicibacterium diernhoferi]PEG55995.1 ABC transporter substrate-binding protein [Mycolicibacterium diernhoferi]QYL22362.1 zinc ABC transporter substrate-binding protein [Mycolicibacterium diernhoferi]